MSQLIALKVQPPVEFDYGAAVEKGQQLASNDKKSQLETMDLAEKKREHSALTAYRDAREAGDPNAGDALKAYPEIYDKFQKAYDSIEDVNEKRTTRKRVKAVGNAARRIASFPAGSPERIKAGTEEVGRLVKEGLISAEQGEAAAKAGFPDLLLKEYVDLGHWADKAIPDSKAELAQARIDEVQARIKNKDAEAEAKLLKIKAEVTKIEASTKSDEQQDAEVEKLQKQIDALEAQANQRNRAADAASSLAAQREAKARETEAKTKEIPSSAEAKRKKDETAAGANTARAEASKAQAEKSRSQVQTPEQLAAKIDKDRAAAEKSRRDSGQAPKPMSDKEIETVLGKYRSDITPQYFSDDDLPKIEERVEKERQRLRKQRDEVTGKAPDAGGSSAVGTKENPAMPTSKADLDKLPKGAYYKYKGNLYKKN